MQALADPKALPVAVPHWILLQLGTSAHTLQLNAELQGSFSFTSAPTALSPARCIYFAKQLVNASLSFLAELATSGWSATVGEASSQVPHVLAAVNTYRVATRFLLLPRDEPSSKAAGKQKELEVETIILRTCSKLKAIGFTEAARADCQYLGRVADAFDTPSADPPSMLLPPIKAQRLRQPASHSLSNYRVAAQRTLSNWPMLLR